MRILVLAALLAGLSGCATGGEHARFRSIMDRYVGSSSDSLILRYGPPATITPLSTGNKVYQYNFIGGTKSSAVGTAFGPNAIGLADSDTQWCQVNFIVEPNNVVADYTFRGNTCAASNSGSVF